MTLAPFDLIDDAYNPLPPVDPRQMSDDENAMLGRLRIMLRRKHRLNLVKERYYEAKQFTRYMDVSVPPMFRAVGVAVGWPGTVVDAMEERMDFRGWASAADLMGLDEIFDDNQMEVESSRAHLDALICGQSFAAVSQGDEDNDEPPILITAESPLRTTMLWDYRKRRAEAAYTQVVDERNRIVMETLYLPDSTITLQRSPEATNMVVSDVDDHNLHRVPVVRLVNRDRASDPHGRSEITRALRYYTDAAVRTVLGMEIHREFYTTPALFALNVRPEMFGIYNFETMTPEQRSHLGWKIMMGHVNLVPPPEPGEAPPDVKQIPSSSPQPYLDQIEGYANMAAGESGLPKSYFGFAAALAPNADSIRQEEYPMVRRVERRLDNFAHTWKQLAYLSLLWRDGAPPDRDKMRALYCDFADPSAPTRSAAADEAQKLTAAKILVPDSAVTYKRVGLSDREIAQLEIDKPKYERKLAMQALQQSLLAPKPAVGGNDPANPGPVARNGNEGVPASAKDPANVQRGRTIAGQAGQG